MYQWRADSNASRPLVKHRFWQLPVNCFEMRGLGPRRKHRLATFTQRDRNLANFGRQFSLAKNHFGPTAASEAVEIDSGKTKISRQFNGHRHKNAFASD